MDDNPGLRFPGRRQEFPTSARDLLKQVEKSVRSIRNAGSRFLRDLQSNIDEHLFCLVDVKGVFTKRLSTWQEVQLLDMLIEFFDEKAGDKTGGGGHYTYFELLFCGHESDRDKGLNDARMEVLVKVLSLSVQLRCAPLLTDAGQWIQRQLTKNPPTDHMFQIANRVVDDYCNEEDYALNLHANLVEIARESPNFVALALPLSFERYDFSVYPPLPYADVVREWLSVCPKSFFRAYQESGGGKNLSTSTPWTKSFSQCYAKLLILTVLAPVSLDVDNRPREIYAKLHLSLLQTMLISSKMNLDNSCKLFTSRNINYCLQKIDEFQQKLQKQNDDRRTDVDESLDRLIQVVQIAVAAKRFQGTRKELDQNVAGRFVDCELLIFVLSNQLSL